MANATAPIRAAFYDSPTLKMVLRTSTERMFAMTSSDIQDNSFPYPLVGGLVGTIVSLAGVWIISTLISFAPVVGG